MWHPLALVNNAPRWRQATTVVMPAPRFVLRGRHRLDNVPELRTGQIDLDGVDSPATMVDDGSRPLFRFVAPTSVPERTLPSLTSCSPTPWQ